MSGHRGPAFHESILGDRRIVNINGATALAGVSRRTIYNWIASSKIEYVRTAGGGCRIFVDTLPRLIACPESRKSEMPHA